MKMHCGFIKSDILDAHKSEDAEEIVSNLLHILSFMTLPSVLQTYNVAEFITVYCVHFS
jgi:hypothetical protein